MKIIIENENDYELAKIELDRIETVIETLENICKYDSRILTLNLIRLDLKNAIRKTEEDAPF